MDRSALRPEPGSFCATERMKHLVCAQILNVYGKKEEKKETLSDHQHRSVFSFFFFCLDSKL